MERGDNVERDQEQASDEKMERLRIDELADFHARLSTVESGHLSLSRRITRLEDHSRGSHSDDPLSGILSPGIMWALVALTLAPVVIEVIRQWKSSSS